MSNNRTAADVHVQGAYNRAVLDFCLEPIRHAARSCGYAVALHGSVSRDIDLIAIPWTEDADDADHLFANVMGAIAGAIGRCHGEKEWKDKPHGRKVRSLHGWVGENSVHFDFGVMPRIESK